MEQEDVKKIEIVKIEDEKIEITADGKYVGRFLHISPKIQSYEHFQDYRRHPIQLSSQSIIMIHHFSNEEKSLDRICETIDMTQSSVKAMEYDYKSANIAAEQFFNQMEGHCCDAFLEAMIIEAAKHLAKSDDRRREMSEKYEKTSMKPACVFENRAQEALDKAAELIKEKNDN